VLCYLKLVWQINSLSLSLHLSSLLCPSSLGLHCESENPPPPDSFFYARQQNASRVFDIVEMSVCPSQYCVKTTQARIAKSSLWTATMTLVSGSAKPFPKFERGHPYRWRKMKRGFKKLAKKPRYWDQFVSPAQQ